MQSNLFIDKPHFLYFITFAGTPPTTAYSGTFPETTDPAAITAPLPI